MKRTIGEAAAGSSEAQKKLSALGLSVKDLKGKTTIEQFDMIAQAISAIKDPAERTAASMKYFKEGGAKMMDFLRNYKAAGEELAARGGIIDDAQLKAAEDFNQSLTNISVTLRGLTVNSGLLSQLTEIVKLIDFAASGKGKQLEKSAAEKGVYNRRTGAQFAVEKIIEKGNYSPEEQKRLREAGKMYGDGDAEHLAALAGVDVHQSKEYALIDAELQARGMGVLARKKRTGLKGKLFGEYYYGEDTVVSAKQTKDERDILCPVIL